MVGDLTRQCHRCALAAARGRPAAVVLRRLPHLRRRQQGMMNAQTPEPIWRRAKLTTSWPGASARMPRDTRSCSPTPSRWGHSPFPSSAATRPISKTRRCSSTSGAARAKCRRYVVRYNPERAPGKPHGVRPSSKACARGSAEATRPWSAKSKHSPSTAAG